MAAGVAARVLPFLVGLGLLPWTSYSNSLFDHPLFDDLEFQIIDSNGSAQVVIDQFVGFWGKKSNLHLRNDAFHGRPRSDSGSALFRRACPLPGGGDCEPTGPANNICCDRASPVFCCGDNFPVCCRDYCCGADAICCSGPGIGCCWDTQQCCGTNDRDGFCCEKDQDCGTDGSCIDRSTTITRTTTLTETESGKTTITETVWNIIERGSTEYDTETVTISDAKTATFLVTRTVTVTDEAQRTSIEVAKRSAALPTATSIPEDVSTLGSEDVLKESETETKDEQDVIYLRLEPSLDPIADFLMARDFRVERRNTVTFTDWITRTTTVGATETITSTDRRTSYVTSIDTEMITETSYVGAEETVTSTTTFTTHVLAGQSNNGGNDNGGGGGGGGSSNNAAIIGGSVGGAIGGLLLILVAFLLWKRHNDKKKQQQPQHPPYNPMMYGQPHPGMYPPQMQQQHWGGGGGYVPTQSPPMHAPYVPPQEMDSTYSQNYTPQPVHEADNVSPQQRSGTAELETQHVEPNNKVSPPPGYQQ